MEADGAAHKFFDFYFLEAFLPDELGDRLWGIKCPHGVGEVLVSAAVMRQRCANPRNQAVEVKGIKEREREAGGGKHIQGNEFSAGP